MKKTSRVSTTPLRFKFTNTVLSWYWDIFLFFYPIFACALSVLVLVILSWFLITRSPFLTWWGMIFPLTGVLLQLLFVWAFAILIGALILWFKKIFPGGGKNPLVGRKSSSLGRALRGIWNFTQFGPQEYILDQNGVRRKNKTKINFYKWFTIPWVFESSRSFLVFAGWFKTFSLISKAGESQQKLEKTRELFRKNSRLKTIRFFSWVKYVLAFYLICLGWAALVYCHLTQQHLAAEVFYSKGRAYVITKVWTDETTLNPFRLDRKILIRDWSDWSKKAEFKILSLPDGKETDVFVPSSQIWNMYYADNQGVLFHVKPDQSGAVSPDSVSYVEYSKGVSRVLTPEERLSVSKTVKESLALMKTKGWKYQWVRIAPQYFEIFDLMPPIWDIRNKTASHKNETGTTEQNIQLGRKSYQLVMTEDPVPGSKNQWLSTVSLKDLTTGSPPRVLESIWVGGKKANFQP